MNRNNSVIIILAAIVLVAGLVVLANFMSDKYDWRMHYTDNVDEPYTFGIFHRLLENREGTKKVKRIERMLKYEMDSMKDNSAYVYLDNSFLEHAEENKLLMDYVARGNNAFICVERLPFSFLDSLSGADLTFSYQQNNAVGVSVQFDTLSDTEFLFYRRYKEDTVSSHWLAIPDEQFEQDFRSHGFESLAYLKLIRAENDSTAVKAPLPLLDDLELNTDSAALLGRQVCFFEYPFGKGKFYFHTLPISLCNIYLAKKDGYEYVNGVLDGLDAEYYYFDKYRYIPNATGTPPDLQSPFAYIYSQKSLRWAMYVIIFGVLLYLLFGAKRRQKIMPVLEQNTNTSIEYAKAVSLLYYQTRSHQFIAGEMSRMFYHFVRQKYALTGKLGDKDFIVMLAKKSGLKKNDIEKINTHYIKIRFNESPSAADLSTYHFLVEEFYKKAK